jgi:hypothetical protein
MRVHKESRREPQQQTDRGTEAEPETDGKSRWRMEDADRDRDSVLCKNKSVSSCRGQVHVDALSRGKYMITHMHTLRDRLLGTSLEVVIELVPLGLLRLGLQTNEGR